MPSATRSRSKSRSKSRSTSRTKSRKNLPHECCPSPADSSRCFFTYSNKPCSKHPLSIHTRKLERAMRNGRGWGNLLHRNETSAERASRERRIAETALRVEAEKEKANVCRHLEKMKRIHLKKGTLKKTYNSICKWDATPAEKGYEAGCAAHRIGACPYKHVKTPGKKA